MSTRSKGSAAPAAAQTKSEVPVDPRVAALTEAFIAADDLDEEAIKAYGAAACQTFYATHEVRFWNEDAHEAFKRERLRALEAAKREMHEAAKAAQLVPPAPEARYTDEQRAYGECTSEQWAAETDRQADAWAARRRIWDILAQNFDDGWEQSRRRIERERTARPTCSAERELLRLDFAHATQRLDDFLVPSTPATPIVQHLLYAGYVTEFVSQPGVGKTALAVTLAVHVAAGKHLYTYPHDYSNPDPEVGIFKRVVQGQVLYIAAENPEDARQHMRAACIGMRIDPARVGAALRILTQPPEVLQSESQASFRRYVAEQGLAGFNPTLVIWDTRMASSGGTDENDSSEAQEFMNTIRSFYPSAAMAIISHPTKYRVQGDQTGSRGSGAYRAAVDRLNYLDVERSEGNVAIIRVSYDQTKTRGNQTKASLYFRHRAEDLPGEVEESTREQVQSSWAEFLPESDVRSADVGARQLAEIERMTLLAIVDKYKGTVGQARVALAMGKRKSDDAKKEGYRLASPSSSSPASTRCSRRGCCGRRSGPRPTTPSATRSRVRGVKRLSRRASRNGSIRRCCSGPRNSSAERRNDPQ